MQLVGPQNPKTPPYVSHFINLYKNDKQTTLLESFPPKITLAVPLYDFTKVDFNEEHLNKQLIRNILLAIVQFC